MALKDRVLDGGPGITALLGPTNTGKTHRAIERMLAYPSGMIGLPLRLLAREVYDRIVLARGADAVALVTGEEKRVPARPRYFVCTVEAMPVDRPVAFLAVDEVQLAADRHRGHVFTDRVLNARGLLETMFLGSDTIEPVLRDLVPTVDVDSRPRFSRLSHAGTRKLTSLAPRSVVVAFSAREIYRIAERLRSRHGGTAVVLGALSPRTRNAQVAMYQSGEVQYMVATDAIGMGLNMDVDHVAFAGLRKYDGRGPRDLDPAELAQIAGRAGRYRRDGTFGTVTEVGLLDPAVVDAIEAHRFPPARKVYFRASDLDFSSIETLVASLARPPHHRVLRPIQGADDTDALAKLLTEPEVRTLARGVDRVALLWEVACIPDFEKTLTDSHARFLVRVFTHLCEGGVLPSDWVAAQLDRLDRPTGDIETLMARIAHVRTWTFVSYRAAWLDDPLHWQERARAIEDRLSDALHEQLTSRFVDRRVMAFTRAPTASIPGYTTAPDVDGDGVVRVSGLVAGRLRGLHFDAAPGVDPGTAVVRRILAPRIEERVRALLAGAEIEVRGTDLLLGGGPLGRVVRGRELYEPRVKLAPTPLLRQGQRGEVQRGLDRWVRTVVDQVRGPMRAPSGLTAASRGLLYALERGLGCADRREVDRAVGALDDRDRRILARQGVRLGMRTVYALPLLDPAALVLRRLLWEAWSGEPVAAPAGEPWGRARGIDPLAVGYRRVGGSLVRVDVLEEVAAIARKRGRRGAFRPPPELDTLLGGEGRVGSVLAGLGFEERDGRFRRRRP